MMAATGDPVRFRLAEFGLSDMIQCGRALRGAPAAESMEEAAEWVVELLWRSLVGAEGERACALLRCFKTHALSRLPGDLAEVARAALVGDEAAERDVLCLTLLASRGDEPEWMGRLGSRGHRAIPLESVAVVERAPMIARLIQQMGMEVRDVLAPTPDFLLDAEQRAFGVFHVAEARGSGYVPAQGFVTEQGIRSVLGFGGLLPSGDLFAVILFSRVRIAREVADLFQTIALSTKLVLLPYVRGPVFQGETASPEAAGDGRAQERQRAEIATLGLLIPALEDVALEQTRRLQAAVGEAQQRTEEVRQLNAALETRVRERTASLVTANAEMEAFSYSVSHDLRAPLRTIEGFSVALEEDCAAELSPTGKGYLGRIRRATVRMGELIDALMELSRVARAELSRSAVDLSGLAGEVAQELREGQGGREVQWRIAPGMVAEGDRKLLRAMLANLLGNAWKFTGRRSPAVIEVGWSAGDGAFFVRDNGEGFAMEEAGQLFQPFKRLHALEEFEGTGIGLATVARVVRRHGGEVWATAEVGVGATFWFRLGPERHADRALPGGAR